MPTLMLQIISYVSSSLGTRIVPTLIQYGVAYALGTSAVQNYLSTLQLYGREDMQQVLDLLGNSLTVDGAVGPRTQAALKSSMTTFGVAPANQSILIAALGIILGFKPL